MMNVVAEPVVSPVSGGNIDVCVTGSKPASSPEPSLQDTRRHGQRRLTRHALGWLVLGRWIAIALIIAASLLDVAFIILRALKRDAVDMPRWHIGRRDPLGLLLQLVIQLPLRSPVTALFVVVTGLLKIAIYSLIGAWPMVGYVAGETGMTTVLRISPI